MQTYSNDHSHSNDLVFKIKSEKSFVYSIELFSHFESVRTVRNVKSECINKKEKNV